MIGAIRRPFKTEWDTSRLPSHRLTYLDSGLSFEQIARRVHAEMQIIRARIKPYDSPAPGEESSDARQVIFLVFVNPETCDLLYNAPDGLRGRYWQSPDHGLLATRCLINQLLPSLTAFAEKNPPACDSKTTPMAREDIETSLEAPSAKIWPREFDDNRNFLFAVQELMVSRWCENEKDTPLKDMWRRSPVGGD